MAPSSTSSSEDEDMTKFIEAADNSLYNKYLKNNEKGTCEAPHLPSLRNVDEQEDQLVHKGLNVTPAFQKHVAHHLTQILDSQILLDENSKDSINTSNDSDDVSIRKIARARRMLLPSRLPPTEHVSGAMSSPKPSQSSSGVRLFGASAVFLSNLDIVPAHTRRRRKRGRKIAQFSSGSESSGEESGSSSDSEDMEKFSAAAVSPDWVLSGAATKGWAHKEGKIERCIINESGILLPLTKGGHCKYGATSNVNINNNEKEVLSDRAKDDLFALRSKKKSKKKKRRALSLDGDTLAASFNAAVSITAESPCDTTSLHHQKKKSRKKRRKYHNSEDATTETTEVEDIGEGRKKKRKKRKKQKKKSHEEEEGRQEIETTPLLKEEEEDEGIIVKGSPSRKGKKKTVKPNPESFLKVRKTISKPLSRQQLKNKMASLSTKLAKLVMGSNEGAQDAVSRV